MANWLHYTDHYFDGIDTSTSAKRQEISTLISSAVELVEKICNRQFLLQEHDRNFQAERDGSILLYSPPVTAIERICHQVSFGTLTHATAPIATFCATETELQLTTTINGTTTTSVYILANYATMTLLADTINAGSWVFTLNSAYASFPAWELVSFQYGSATSARQIMGWKDYPGSTQWHQEVAQLSGFQPWESVRVLYTGGFSDVPEPIKDVTANLAKGKYEGGTIKSESLGGYSYTMEDAERLPNSDRKVLGLYRCKGGE